MDSDLDDEFSPKFPPRGHYSDLGPKGAQKEPKGAKRVLKDINFEKDPNKSQTEFKKEANMCKQIDIEVFGGSTGYSGSQESK